MLRNLKQFKFEIDDGVSGDGTVETTDCVRFTVLSKQQ